MRPTARAEWQAFAQPAGLRPAAALRVEFARRAAREAASLRRLAEQVVASRQDGLAPQTRRVGAVFREIPARPADAAVRRAGRPVVAVRAGCLAPLVAAEARRVAVAHWAAVPAAQRDAVERPAAEVVASPVALPAALAAQPDEPRAVAGAEPDVQREELAVRGERPAEQVVPRVAVARRVLPLEVERPVWPLAAGAEPPSFSFLLRFARASAALPARTTVPCPSDQFARQRTARQTSQPKPASPPRRRP